MGMLPRRSAIGVLLVLAAAGATGSCGDAGGESTMVRAPAATDDVVALAILDDLEPRVREAFRMAKQRRFNKAQELVTTYLKQAGRKANHAHARFVQAFAYQRMDHNEQARQLFEWVIQKRPDYIDVQHYYGFCLYHLGDLEGAREAFETYLHHWPDQSAPYHGLGMVALQDGRVDDAKQALERSIALHPDEQSEQLGLTFTRLGDVYMRLDCPADARREYSRAVETWPTLDEAWYALHRVLLRLGEEVKAQAALDQHSRLVARESRQRPDGR